MDKTIAEQQQTLDDHNVTLEAGQATLKSDQDILAVDKQALAAAVDHVGDAMDDLTVVAKEISDDNRKETVKQQKRTRWLIYPIIIVLLYAIVIGLYVKIGSVEKNLNDATLVNRETGYKNRAQTCRINLTLGTPPDEFCLEPEVTQYYDPTVQPTVGEKSSTRSLMCKNSDDLNEIRVALGLPDEAAPVECKYFPRN